ncbi:hypothetical protein GCK72_022322 [Caenorhabditis remanei]|uniref:DUF38 domain-containing protein n=1 Tax=Caenorhabditis remanei TaxID=31234 RepID=A0A6A5FTQ6_CAERE|nr:hypothetical protein GCK72_022322 [Caenorhabditis remanei]KAF1745875.1 hypothetical protein GCK72_022322 [Caenorhabditis remanei]
MSKSNENKKRGVAGQVKVKEEEPEMDDDNLAPPPPAKRGPGRPRKAERAGERRANSQHNRPVANLEDDMSRPPQAKRGRGRPRRVVLAEDEGGSSRDAPPAKRGRGRPKREVKAEEGELNILHIPPANSVAGRTRSQILKKNIKIEEEDVAPSRFLTGAEEIAIINREFEYGIIHVGGSYRPGAVKLEPQENEGAEISGARWNPVSLAATSAPLRNHLLQNIPMPPRDIKQEFFGHEIDNYGIVKEFSETGQFEGPVQQLVPQALLVPAVFQIAGIKQEPQNYDEQFENQGRVEEYIAPVPLQEKAVDYQAIHQPQLLLQPVGSPVTDVFPLYIKVEPQDYYEQSDNQRVFEDITTPVPFHGTDDDSHRSHLLLQPGGSPVMDVFSVHIKEEPQEFEELTADAPPFEHQIVEVVEPAEWVGNCVKVPDEKWKRWEEEREAGMKEYMARLTEECRRFDPRILEMFGGRIPELTPALILLLQRGSQATHTWEMSVSTEQIWRVMDMLQNNKIAKGSIKVKNLKITTTRNTKCINGRMLARWMSYIDPATLQKISIQGNFTHGALRQLSKTEQWKSCKAIELDSKNLFTFNLLFKKWRGNHLRVFNVTVISKFADEWKSFVQAFKRKAYGSSFEIRAKEYIPFPATSYIDGKVRVTTALFFLKGVVEDN